MTLGVLGHQEGEENEPGSTAWPVILARQWAGRPLVSPVLSLVVDFEGIFLLPVTPLSASLKMQLWNSSCSRPPGTEDSVLGPILLLGLALAAILAHKNIASAGVHALSGDCCRHTLPA